MQIQFNLQLSHCYQTPYSMNTQPHTFSLHIITIYPISAYVAHRASAIPCHSLRWTASLRASSQLFHPCSSLYAISHASIHYCITNIDSRGFLQFLGQVSYGDIDHWMWRLYLDDFGEFCDSIGLPVCPYAELRPDDPLPPPTTLLYGISPRVIEKPQYWPER